MQHTITLNRDTPLSVRAIIPENPEEVLKGTLYPHLSHFTADEAEKDLGYVHLEAIDTQEHVAIIDGTRVYNELYFGLTHSKTQGYVWNVYNFADNTEDDIELDDLPESAIPQEVVDILS